MKHDFGAEKQGYAVVTLDIENKLRKSGYATYCLYKASLIIVTGTDNHELDSILHNLSTYQFLVFTFIIFTDLSLVWILVTLTNSRPNRHSNQFLIKIKEGPLVKDI